MDNDPDLEFEAGGAGCFDSAQAAGTEASWNVIQYTVEGDPIIQRYELAADGSLRTLTDNSRDAFGAPGPVMIHDCAGVGGEEVFPPVGADCVANTEFDLPSLPLPVREG